MSKERKQTIMNKTDTTELKDLVPVWEALHRKTIDAFTLSGEDSLQPQERTLYEELTLRMIQQLEVGE